MRGRMVMLLLLTASVALGGLARAAPAAAQPVEVSRADEALARGQLAALNDPDDEVVSWTLVALT